MKNIHLTPADIAVIRDALERRRDTLYALAATVEQSGCSAEGAAIRERAVGLTTVIARTIGEE